LKIGQATDDNMAHAHYVLDIYGYKHTLIICNIFCFSSTTVGARRHLNVTFYVLCLSCCQLCSGSVQISKYTV